MTCSYIRINNSKITFTKTYFYNNEVYLLLSEEDIKKQIKELENEANRIKTDYFELLKKRKDVFKFAGISCLCSGDCKDSLTNESIGASQQHDYCHDDTKQSDVTVDCITGEILVITYVSVWASWMEVERETLGAGKSWVTKIPNQDSWYDQANRVQITGNMDSIFNLVFESKA